jgi:ribosomal protein S18 acetylase RimI-like enzyme
MSNIENITYLIFDWGDTLMVDDPAQDGAMAFWDDIRACEGVVVLLPLLSAKYTCAVASNAVDSDSGLMKKAFERVGLAEYLACFFTLKELGVKKPTPDFFIKAAQAIGVNPNNCAMIGNSYTSDICGAKEVDMTTVLITRELGEYPLADYVAENFEDLAEVFDIERCGVTIRPAKENDIAALAEYDKHIPTDVLAQKITNGEIYVAYDGGAFVGWLRYGLFWDNTPFMNMLYVLDAYRRMGIGKKLTQFWEAQMRAKGFATLMTSTQQNETAQHFYTHLRYRSIGGFMQLSGEYEIIFSKEIGRAK